MATGTSIEKTPFRRDIAGLRAIAVIAVVMYHFGVPGFQGGFAGVDIFFVISGYLMTGIISKGLDQDKFDLIQFYLARARRIIPALAVLCAVLMAVGWVILVPVDYQALGKRVASSIAFLSNIEYWKESSAYFDVQQKENWVLHTWSLSVEWQFYMAFPILMILLRSLFKTPVTRIVIVVIAAISLALSIYMSPRWPNISFYTPITRGWEMLAGSIIYLFPVSLGAKTKPLVERLGLCLLVCSIVLLQPSRSWPGHMALLPVVGASLILMAGNPLSYLAKSKVLQSLGEASYSIYLWHWPVAVYLAYTYTVKTPLTLVAALALAVALGYLSLYVIERPTRNFGLKSGRVRAVSGYALVTAAVFTVGVSVFMLNGIQSRASDLVNLATREGVATHEASACTIFRGVDSPKCVVGAQGAKVSVIVLGDSHAESSVNAVVKAAGAGQGALLLAYIGCIAIADVKIRDSDTVNECGRFMREQIVMLRTQYIGLPVVVINRLSRYVLGPNEDREREQLPMIFFDQPSVFNDAFKAEFTKRYVAGICDLAANHPVYITAPTPEIGVNVPAVVSRSLFRQGVMPQVGISRREYDERNEFARSAIDAAVKECGVVELDPAPYLCDKDNCEGVAGNVPLYFDDNHLSASGGDRLVPMYEQIWRRKLAGAP